MADQTPPNSGQQNPTSTPVQQSNSMTTDKATFCESINSWRKKSDEKIDLQSLLSDLHVCQ